MSKVTLIVNIEYDDDDDDDVALADIRDHLHDCVQRLYERESLSVWMDGIVKECKSEVLFEAPSIEDVAALLRKILSASDSHNNGMIMGEAVLCEYFAQLARETLRKLEASKS